MKVKELILRLQRLKQNQDDEVVIPVYIEGVMLGRYPSVNIIEVNQGIDWDSGQVFLQSKEVLEVKKDD